MKIVRTSMTAVAAVLALATIGFGTAQAETVEIKTGATSAVQTSQGPVTQAGAAVAVAIGDIRNNSELKAISAATNNTSDIDMEIDANGADANSSTSFSANLTGELHNLGNYAYADGAASTTNGVLGFGGGSASEYSAGNGAWNEGGSLTGSLAYNASTDLPSLSYASATNGIVQTSLAPVTQNNFALVGSGAVQDYSKSGATAVGQNNASTVKVVVKN
jgi:hypothetical protein